MHTYCKLHANKREVITYLFIPHEYLALLTQLRWAMSETLYVGRVIADAHVLVKPITISNERVTNIVITMTPVSDKAFAIMAVCPEAKKYYGITIDYLRKNAYKFVWAFKIEKDKAKREGYDSQRVHGSVELDAEYPGCPYCKSKQFIFCSCSAVMCWHGQHVVTCPFCGQTGKVSSVSSVDLHGGGL